MNNPNTPLFSKQVPHSVENEQALLGALILDSERLGDVSSVVSSEDFYVDKHAEIYNSLVSLSNRSSGIDVVTLLSDLVKNGVYTEEQGSQYIRHLAESVPTLSNIMDYAAIVHEKNFIEDMDKEIERLKGKRGQEAAAGFYSQAELDELIGEATYHFGGARDAHTAAAAALSRAELALKSKNEAYETAKASYDSAAAALSRYEGSFSSAITEESLEKQRQDILDKQAALDRAYADNLWSPDGWISEAAVNTAMTVLSTSGLYDGTWNYADMVDLRFVPAPASPDAE
jgi:hypothetical protein